jgi:hypothetical protein
VTTILPIDRYARVLGINPLHFAGATGDTVFPTSGFCDDVWPQHTWQTQEELVSREEIAEQVRIAEEQIMEVLGYWPGPTWTSEEVVPYPQFYRKTRFSGPTARNEQRKTVQARHRKIISPGRRAVTAIEEGATVTYSDPDGDGYNETATVTVSTTITDSRQVKVYFAGKSAHPTWEIRPNSHPSRPTSNVAISGGTATITMDSWMFIDPDLWEAYPTADPLTAIDASDSSNLVSTVDVYREYTDNTQDSCTFYWTNHTEGGVFSGAFCDNCGGSGCSVCGQTSQGGCLSIRDAETGYVIPIAAGYSAADAAWVSETYSISRDPDQVKLWYRSGLLSNDYLSSYTDDPISEGMAQAIAWLATARLDKPVCGCSNVRNAVATLQQDTAIVSRERATFINIIGPEALKNPFGTRVGEVRAWNYVARMIE